MVVTGYGLPLGVVTRRYVPSACLCLSSPLGDATLSPSSFLFLPKLLAPSACLCLSFPMWKPPWSQNSFMMLQDTRNTPSDGSKAYFRRLVTVWRWFNTGWTCFQMAPIRLQTVFLSCVCACVNISYIEQLTFDNHTLSDTRLYHDHSTCVHDYDQSTCVYWDHSKWLCCDHSTAFTTITVHAYTMYTSITVHAVLCSACVHTLWS